MKFSSSFSAIVVASVATAQLSAAAPLGGRAVVQGSSQGTTQQGTGAAVSQNNSSDQHNTQGVKVAKDNSLFLNSPVTSDSPSFVPAPPVVAPGPAVAPKGAAPPAPAPAAPAPAPAPEEPAAPVKFDSKTGDLINLGILDNNKANAEVAGTGNQGNARRSSTGDLIDLGALNQNAANLGALATGNQGNSYKNAGSAVPHGDGQTGDLIDAGLINNNAANAEVLGTGHQGNLYSRQLLGLLGSQGAKQEGSADGAGGNSLQGQLNRPVLSGASNSLTAGGAENAANNGQGGSLEQGLKQAQDLGGLLRKRLLGAQGAKQGASANGAGGNSLQGALNNPVLSGAGNSLTAGGPQSSQNDGAGGQIQQGLKQVQDLEGLLRKRLLGAQGGKQGASANGYGGNSGQGQGNLPVLSGAGNSLTAGGPQGATNDGEGGSIAQGIKQVEDLGGLLRKRLLGAQGGKQSAGANGYGGKSGQLQGNLPVLSGAGNSLTSGGLEGATNDGNGGSIEQGLKQVQDLEGLLRKRLLGAQGGKQGASADGYGGNSGQLQGNLPVLSGAGNSLTSGGAETAANNGQGGSIEQGLKQVEDLGGLVRKRLLGAQGGKQSGSADGLGGHSGQLQGNTPVLSGYSNSLTAGGSQGAQNNGQGGSVGQSLEQLQDLGGLLKRQYFAAGHQFGSADGFGGHSIQGQSNVPVVSGYGNSVTAGGPQEGENNGYGGGVQQSLGEGLGMRQLGALGLEGGRADGYGGESFQYQSNRPVVSGYGNSVTAGGPQGASNNGQGGTVDQGLKELFARQYQGLGQGIGQGIHQYGSAEAEGGNAFVAGANGPTFINTGAKGGVVNQYANGQQADGQSGTQGLEQERYNNFYGPGYFRREIQGMGQGAAQGVDQVGSAAAHGGSAFVAGSNGPTYIKTGAQGGVVNQNGEANQQDEQSGTQGLGEGFYNYFAARDIQSLGQSASQDTKQTGSADAAGGPASLVGSSGPTVVDTSGHAGAVTQSASSNQQDNQKAGQSDEHLFYNGWYRRGGHNEYLSQGNAQNVNTNADASAHSAAANLAYLKDAGIWTHDPTSFDAALSGAKAGDVSQIVGASQNAAQKANQYGKRFIPYAGGLETGNADALGGDSLDLQHNGKVVEGNGVNSVQGGPQSENGSSQGGSLSQLLNL